MATQQPQKLLQTPAGLSLLQKVLNGQGDLNQVFEQASKDVQAAIDKG